MNSIPFLILPAAFILDRILGDPAALPHPIRWMGHAIQYAEPRFRKRFSNPIVAGGCFALFLIASAYTISLCLILCARWIHPVFGLLLETVLIYYCLSARSLNDAAIEVYHALSSADLEDARQKTAMIVGRETASLDEAGLTRAAVETVAENLVDGVLAPLFFAALGGAPLALAYKMVNTLDSMVGYKNDRYLYFGKVAARIDDTCNFIPARLSVCMISAAAQITGQRGKQALQTALLGGQDHASPNAGYPEAAFAGALEVKLGGPNVYHGKRVHKPYIGKKFGPAAVHHIRQAGQLMFTSAWIGLGCFWLLHLAVHYG